MKDFNFKPIAQNGIDKAKNAYQVIVTMCEKLLQKTNLPDRYLPHSEREQIIESIIRKCTGTLNKIKFFNKIKLENVATIQSILSTILEQHNKQFVNKEIMRHSNLFDNILGHSLDDEQRKAIVSDDDRCLIVAGAGAGKTLTMVGKVAYLYHVKHILPEEILLISFTNKAAQEMQERLSKQLNIQIPSYTFHKLGKDIITQNTPDVLNVADTNILSKTIRDYYTQTQDHNDTSSENLLHFLSYYLYVPITKDENVSIDNIENAEKASDLETLRSKVSLIGERMKSQEEVMIANFLYLNGIEYEYERPYPKRLSFSYKPDFYLPDYNIYLEHFGVTRKMTCPWLSPIAAQKYVADINKKRKLHKQHETKLIETYSYYQSEGILLTKLRDELLKNGVKIKPRNPQEIVKKISERGDRRLIEFERMMSSFITLFKSQGYGEQDLSYFSAEHSGRANSYFIERNRLFIAIAKDIFKKYQKELQKSNLIDFSDMIWNATSIVKNDITALPYKYIIIDEYQDIGKDRYTLIKEILEKTGAKLVCIGDDWQSIYRFAGSEISLFTSFKDYWGPSAVFKLTKTYRNAQELIDICNNFIVKNPIQIPKQLISDKHLETPIKLVGYTDTLPKQSQRTLTRILDEIAQNFSDSSVLLLGRHKNDINFLQESNVFSICPNTLKIVYKKHPNLKITFLTVHKAKGLEADNVVLINCKNAYLGFPNKITDDPIMRFLLSKPEFTPYAEERRLMYVALTRTKNYVYLMVPRENPSEFVSELIQLGVSKTTN